MTVSLVQVAVLAFVLALPSGCFKQQTNVELKVIDQDINENESEVADRAIKVLLGLDNIQMVMCRRAGLYEVHGREGKVFFRRLQGEKSYIYEEVRVVGKNPLARQDPRALPDLKSELAAGANPKKTDYSAQDSGYTGPDDPLISFLLEENISYPVAYERIAALFDGEHVGDLVVEFTPWGWYPLGEVGGLDNPGAHGQLSVVSSRAPLIFAGKGAKRNKVIDGWATSVDIAPTIARAMGIKKTWGVDAAGRYSHDVYLKWQDGRVLEEVLDGETPDHVLIITNDALTHSELIAQLETEEPLPTYRWLRDNGTMYRYGQIVNFPSNTYPSHNTIGSGAWSGHHGLIDNWYYDRKAGKRHDPVVEVFEMGEFLVDEVETLFEAVQRSFDNWHPEHNPLGNFTVSLNTPSTRGADVAILEGIQPIDWDRCPDPTGLGLPALDSNFSQRGQVMDNLGVTIFVKAYLGTREIEGKKVRCCHPPRYTYINFGLTDDAQHEVGPHAPLMKEVLIQTDKRQQILFDTLKKAGVFDRTLFVFTSDHGQSLQDVARVADFQPALREAGIGFKATHAFIYLLTFDITVSISTGVVRQGERTKIELTVRDDDTRKPVAGAVATIESGSATATGTSDATGRVVLELTPGADGATLTVSDGPAVKPRDRRTDHVKRLP